MSERDDDDAPVCGPTFRPVTVCPHEGKVGHASRKVAVTEMRRHLAKLRRKGERATLNVYPCGRCGLWHVGGNDPGRPGQSRRRDEPRRKRVEFYRGEEAA